MPERSRTEKPVPDEEVLQQLARAQKQYDRYLELARLAAFVELTARVEPSPPAADTPLSLTIWPTD